MVVESMGNTLSPETDCLLSTGVVTSYYRQICHTYIDMVNLLYFDKTTSPVCVPYVVFYDKRFDDIFRPQLLGVRSVLIRSI